MSRLANQEIRIRLLAATTQARRVLLVDACRSINDPVDKALKSAGFILTVREMIPGLFAILGLVFDKMDHPKRRERLSRVARLASLLLRSFAGVKPS